MIRPVALATVGRIAGAGLQPLALATLGRLTLPVEVVENWPQNRGIFPKPSLRQRQDDDEILAILFAIWGKIL